MENEMRGIGEMARASGLSVSALRFYDNARVLVPAWVHPISGYRWYEAGQLEEALLLASLRRAGMPLADIRLVLAGWSDADPDLVRHLLAAHLRRLERGLADARVEFSTLRTVIDDRENTLTPTTPVLIELTLSAAELAAALDAVRFAAGTDPELPSLGGVLFDVTDGHLDLVATDRYRMAVARTRTLKNGGPRTRVVVPLPLADAMRALLTGDETVRFSVDGDRVRLAVDDRQAAGPSLGEDFPDYRRLVRLPAGHLARVDTATFREALRSGPVRVSEPDEQDGARHDLSVLRVTRDATVIVCEDGDDDPDNVAVNRAFLLDALAAGARDELILELGAPTAPLAIRRPDDDGSFSILMPVRLTQ